MNNHLPRAPADRAVLLARAEKLARPRTLAATTRSGELFLSVRLGGDGCYGLPYRFLEELIPPVGVEPIPCTPATIVGVLNRRGELLTVVDLRPLLGLATLPAPAPLVAVVRVGGLGVGLLVESVDGYDRFLPEQLAPSLSHQRGADRPWVSGIHQGRIAMLDLDALLSGSALTVGG